MRGSELPVMGAFKQRKKIPVLGSSEGTHLGSVHWMASKVVEDRELPEVCGALSEVQ